MTADGERRVTVETVIECPPEVVFDFIADPGNDPSWCPSVSDVELDEGTARYRFVQHVGPLRHRETARIIATERPNRLRWRFTAMGSLVETSVELHAEGGATRLVQTNRISGIGQLHRLIQRYVAEHELPRQLAALKQVLETS